MTPYVHNTDSIQPLLGSPRSTTWHTSIAYSPSRCSKETLAPKKIKERKEKNDY